MHSVERRQHMGHEDTTSIVRTPYEAFNARDLDRAISVVADDATWTIVPTGQTFRGREGLRKALEQWNRAFPEGKLEDLQVRVGDGFAVVEFTGRGTNAGPVATPGRELPATHRAVELRFCDVLEIAGGKITGGRTYYDAATLMTQLGMMPPVPAGATA
jgi:steroid delta-isomerase-like uncharacterized protein